MARLIPARQRIAALEEELRRLREEAERVFEERRRLAKKVALEARAARREMSGDLLLSEAEHASRVLRGGKGDAPR